MTKKLDALKRQMEEAGLKVKVVPADPEAPVRVQIGGRPPARERPEALPVPPERWSIERPWDSALYLARAIPVYEDRQGTFRAAVLKARGLALRALRRR